MLNKLLYIVLVLLCLTGCATVAEPSSADANTVTPEAIATTTAPWAEIVPMAESNPAETVAITSPESSAPTSFDLTNEALLLTEENSPDAVGGYVQCPGGYLANYFDSSDPEGYLIVSDVDPDTLFKVVGVTYISDASCSPSTELESVPPVTRADFVDAPHYEPPEDPDNIHDFDYFEYLGAVIPICHGANAFLLIQETEISPIYRVPPAQLEVVGG